MSSYIIVTVDVSVVDVTFIDAVSGKGCVQVSDVISAVRPTTCLVTVMLANNETGIIQVFIDNDHKLHSHYPLYMAFCLFCDVHYIITLLQFSN